MYRKTMGLIHHEVMYVDVNIRLNVTGRYSLYLSHLNFLPYSITSLKLQFEFSMLYDLAGLL